MAQILRNAGIWRNILCVSNCQTAFKKKKARAGKQLGLMGLLNIGESKRKWEEDSHHITVVKYQSVYMLGICVSAPRQG